MKLQNVIIICIAMFVLAGCASSRSGKVYTRDQARQTQSVQYGVVHRVDSVLIEGTKSNVGILAGGATGGVLGSTIGSGSGKAVAVVLGSIAGGLAGAAAEEGITRKEGLEINVDMDNGQSIVIVQEADVLFNVGDRVRIIKGPDGTTRVRH